jgi:SAM-dependent methyltransferase
MFFPERITGINDNDFVLEIGPGGNPHPRADVFLEKIYSSEQEYSRQRGGIGRAIDNDGMINGKKVVLYDGNSFPFADKCFDYIICSHVLEHVSDPEGFMNEVFRVGKKGYFEYPRIYYEYLYNIPEHVTLLRYSSNVLRYCSKSDISIFVDYRSIQKFMLKSMEYGYVNLIERNKDIFFESFEWDKPFSVEMSRLLKDFFIEESCLSPAVLFQEKEMEKETISKGFIRFAKKAIKTMVNRIHCR